MLCSNQLCKHHFQRLSKKCAEMDHFWLGCKCRKYLWKNRYSSFPFVQCSLTQSPMMWATRGTQFEQSWHLTITLQICLAMLEGRIQFPNLQAVHLKHTFPFGAHTTCSLCLPETQICSTVVRQRLSICHYKLVTCPRFTFAMQIFMKFWFHTAVGTTC